MRERKTQEKIIIVRIPTGWLAQEKRKMEQVVDATHNVAQGAKNGRINAPGAAN